MKKHLLTYTIFILLSARLQYLNMWLIDICIYIRRLSWLCIALTQMLAVLISLQLIYSPVADLNHTVWYTCNDLIVVTLNYFWNSMQFSLLLAMWYRISNIVFVCGGWKWKWCLLSNFEVDDIRQAIVSSLSFHLSTRSVNVKYF